MNKRKTILLIGASGGLGQAITEHFKNKAYSLALHFNKSPISVDSENIKTYSANLCFENEVIEMIEKVKKDFGCIDIVVNTAGISNSNISWKTPLEEWQETINVNLTAPFLVTKHVLPIMRSNNFGRLIYMSSVVAQTGMAGASAYAASKAGLFGLTKSIDKEIGNKNITVNAIALGYFDAGMISDVPEPLKNEIIQAIPKRRLGKPQELSHLIDFIISDDAAYFTGQTINLNGGLYN